MAAIEYGSYYWCVILNGADGATDSVHLHADSLAIEGNGTLTFKSRGRRPAGTEPKQEKNKHEGNGDDKNKRDDQEQGQSGDSMVYMAFAPGTWRVVYAAKLQDGAPASVEHWNRGSVNTHAPAATPAEFGSTPNRQ